MSRRRFTEREVLECLVRQGAVIPCKRCRVAFTVETVKTAEREHHHEVKLDGPDAVENCFYSHSDCHKVETFGNGATTAGSSIGRISKTKRIERTQKFIVKKEVPETITEEIQEPRHSQSRPWPSPKMQSRPFPKIHRPMRRRDNAEGEKQ